MAVPHGSCFCWLLLLVLMILAAPVLHSRLSCVAPAALALAEFVGAYRPALQLLGLRAGSPKEEPATLLAWLPALCRLRQEGFDPALFPLSSSLIYLSTKPTPCRSARELWLASLAHNEGADRVLGL